MWYEKFVERKIISNGALFSWCKLYLKPIIKTIIKQERLISEEKKHYGKKNA